MPLRLRGTILAPEGMVYRIEHKNADGLIWWEDEVYVFWRQAAIIAMTYKSAGLVVKVILTPEVCA